MKKSLRIFTLFILILSLLSGDLSFPARAESENTLRSARGVEVSVNKISSAMTYNGEESLTHGWIIVDAQLNNESFDDVIATEVLSAVLTYNGLYSYAAEVVFPVSLFEPLVTLPGELVFRVPKRVANAGYDEISILVHADGESLAVSPAGFGRMRSSAAMQGKAFSQPEEAIAYLFECLKNADIEGAYSAFYHNAYASGMQYDSIVSGGFSLPVISETSLFPFPEYEEYRTLTLMQKHPHEEISQFLISMLLPFDFFPPSSMYFTVRNDVATGYIDAEKTEIPAESLKESMNPERLKSLSLQEIRLISFEPTERRVTNRLRTAYRAGGTDYQEYLALFSFEGREFAIGITLIQYPEGWLISTLRSDTFMNYESNARFGAPVSLEELSFDLQGESSATWKNGAFISEGLPAPAVSRGDFIGEWVCADGTILLTEEEAFVSGSDEKGHMWLVNSEYLFIFPKKGNDIGGFYSYQLDGDRLTLISENGTFVLTRK